VCYGSGPGKLQSTFGWSKRLADDNFKKFWRENGALGSLRDAVIKFGQRHGYLPGIDGRAIRLRGAEHAWLNALFQSCGAIAMNVSMVLLNEHCKELGIDYNQVIYYHDEIASEVSTESIIESSENTIQTGAILSKCGRFYSAYGEQAVLSVREAGQSLQLRCELDACYQVGDTWADIH